MARGTTGWCAPNEWRRVVVDQRLCETVSAEYDAAKAMNGDWVDSVKLLSTMQAASRFI